MSGYAIWLIGNSSDRKASIVNELGERLRSDGHDVQVLNRKGGFTSFAAASEVHDSEWGGYIMDAIHISKLLTRRGTSVIVPVTSVSRDAYEIARLELEHFAGVYISDNGSVGPYSRQVELAAGNGSSTAVGSSAASAGGAVDAIKSFDTVNVGLSASVQESLDLILSAVHLAGDDQCASDEDDEPEVSILMPCLNEADAIGECVAEAKQTLIAANIKGEILVVDNGSTDGSPQIAEAAGARVVHESRRGYGSAHLRGIKEARGKYLIMGDSDGTYDFTLIPEFLKRLKEGHEFVNGSRIRGEMDDGAIPFLHRHIGVPVLTWTLNVLSGANFSDAHCGMRGFTREAALRMGLSSPGMEFASEMILQAARENLRTTEMPIPYRLRKGESKLRTFSDGWRHIRFMLLHSPTHLFIMPGAAMLMIGMVMMPALVGGRLEIGATSFDIHYMVVGSMLAMVGYQLAILGISARMYALSIGLFRHDLLIARGMRYLNLSAAC